MELPPSKCGAMEGDRLSSLPDDILHSILHGLPLKDMVRTSGVSRRFEKTWLNALAASPILDFTDRDFVSGRDQTATRAARTVERCLARHAELGAPLHVLRVALDGSSLDDVVTAFAQDITWWVVSSVARGAREVEVNLTPCGESASQLEVDEADDNEIMLFLELPGNLFMARNSLVRLALDRFSLRAVPPDAAGLTGLHSLSLSHADVTDEGVQTVLSSCHSLEFLRLQRCHLLASVRIIGDKLRSLEIVSCLAMRELRVTAPSLESFAFHGDIIVYVRDEDVGGFVPAATNNNLGATPLLRDAYLSHIGFGDVWNHDQNDAYSNFILSMAVARTLTVCSDGLLMFAQAEYNPDVDVGMPNLQELQLLMAFESYIYLEAMSAFFQVNPLPLLDRLFIRILDESSNENRVEALYSDDEDYGNLYIEGEDFVLGHLRLIKMLNFRGTWFQLMMLSILVKRAPVLEQLVLVTAEQGDELLEITQGHVSAIRKASPEVRVIVCRPSEDSSENAAHSRLYHE
ncbi:hypothetical protein QOZ80_1BG0053490 [Eleusine coracana subsp. coracana]|nr:hypothetical protein QOZ80_1BG0053490 [Eleusine coracana subsp. coracana]